MFEVGGEMFSFTGKTVVDPGYTAVMPWHAIPPEEDVPSSCETGQIYSIKEVCRMGSGFCSMSCWFCLPLEVTQQQCF